MPIASALTIKVSLRWWLLIYLHCLAIFCLVTCMTPDPEKLHAVIRRGIKIG